MKKLTTILIACTIIEAIQTLRPGAEWVLNGDQYRNLTWIDKTKPKPTKLEIDQAILDCTTREAIEKAAKAQAVIDAKDTTKTPQTRLDALIKAIDLK